TPSAATPSAPRVGLCGPNPIWYGFRASPARIEPANERARSPSCCNSSAPSASIPSPPSRPPPLPHPPVRPSPRPPPPQL
ncbi:conserved hypothetical protein, partial [Ixodes scapularis]